MLTTMSLGLMNFWENYEDMFFCLNVFINCMLALSLHALKTFRAFRPFFCGLITLEF